jgi:putative flippase GtrA
VPGDPTLLDQVSRPVGADHPGPSRDDGPTPVLDLVVPVYNEAHVLAASVRRLHDHLRTTMPYPWRITIADNASTDGTAEVARQVGLELDRIRVIQLDRKGRGLALRTAWSASDATVLAYTDVDLSTDLDALLPLVAPLVSGHSDVAIGSRLARGASVARGPRRELLSRGYNTILRVLFAVRFTDAQCGFKAIRADAARVLLPEVADDAWFFDTELLLLADRNELRIHEVAVDWVDDPDSRVDVARTAFDDLRGVARMAMRFLRGRGRIDEHTYQRPTVADDMGRQLCTFALLGAISTAVSLTIFLALRGLTGAATANAVALTATALGNVWANRRYTFGRRDRGSRGHDYLRGAALYVVGLALSTAALVWVAGAGLWAELAAVLSTWTLTALCRFALLRGATTTPRKER